MVDVLLDILNNSLKDIIEDLRWLGKDYARCEIRSLVTVSLHTTFTSHSVAENSFNALKKAYIYNLFDYLVFVKTNKGLIELVLSREI